MRNRRPKLPGKGQHRISVICEGYEEEMYFKRLLNLGLWSPKYCFKLINVKAASKILSKYEYEYRNEGSELILVFCDTDRPPYAGYMTIRNGIADILGCSPDNAEQVLMYANPCTMQILLLHFDSGIRLMTQSKRKNAPLIEQLTGVVDYDAHTEQINPNSRSGF